MSTNPAPPGEGNDCAEVLLQQLASRSSLDGFLHEHLVVALAGLDTRALTRHLRRHGTMMGDHGQR